MYFMYILLGVLMFSASIQSVIMIILERYKHVIIIRTKIVFTLANVKYIIWFSLEIEYKPKVTTMETSGSITFIIIHSSKHCSTVTIGWKLSIENRRENRNIVGYMMRIEHLVYLAIISYFVWM